MPYYHIYLRTYERRFRFAPPVYSLALFNGLPMQYQKMDRLEFTYRLSTGIPQISLRVNGRSLELPAPHLLIKRPGDEIEHPAPAEQESFWISYPKETMELFRAGGLPDGLTGCGFRFTPEFSRILREIHQTAPHAMESGMCEKLDMLCFNLIQETLMNLRQCGENDCTGAVEKIAEYFRNNFTSDIDLELLLSSQGLSRRSFFRRWKDSYSMPPAQYIIHLKMAEACRLLAETEKNLSEITLALNFQSTSYFCNLFRRRFGITPLEFRKANRLNFIR